MEKLPNFETMICSEDLHLKFMKNLKKYPKQIGDIFGAKVMVLKVMPPNSAIFIDHEGKPVAIYKDGKIALPKK